MHNCACVVLFFSEIQIYFRSPNNFRWVYIVTMLQTCFQCVFSKFRQVSDNLVLTFRRRSDACLRCSGPAAKDAGLPAKGEGRGRQWRVRSGGSVNEEVRIVCMFFFICNSNASVNDPV